MIPLFHKDNASDILAALVKDGLVKPDVVAKLDKEMLSDLGKRNVDMVHGLFCTAVDICDYDVGELNTANPWIQAAHQEWIAFTDTLIHACGIASHEELAEQLGLLREVIAVYETQDRCKTIFHYWLDHIRKRSTSC